MKEQNKLEEKFSNDEKFGVLLRKQMRENQAKGNVEDELNQKFAAIVEQSSRKSDEVQQKRKEDANRRHRQVFNTHSTFHIPHPIIYIYHSILYIMCVFVWLLCVFVLYSLLTMLWRIWRKSVYKSNMSYAEKLNRRQ